MNELSFIGIGLGSNQLYGIHRNTLQLLKSIDALASDEVISLLTLPSENMPYRFKRIKVMPIGINLSFLGSFGMILERYLCKNVFIPRYARKHNAVAIDMLLHFPKYGCDVVTVYDIIPELFPINYTTKKRLRNRSKLLERQKNALDKARMVLTDSETTKADLMRLYDLHDDMIRVVPCAWQHMESIGEDESIIDRLGLRNKEFFFSLGSILPHKNTKWILEAAKQNKDMLFVITGANMHGSTVISDSSDENVLYTGYLSDEEVKALMWRCRAFIQPSLYEGFGLPPMEAMSVGADCIVSDKGSLPEVYGDSVWYIDPYDYDHIDLTEIMSRPKEPNERVLERYSWEKSARILLDALRNLAG